MTATQIIVRIFLLKYYDSNILDLIPEYPFDVIVKDLDERYWYHPSEQHGVVTVAEDWTDERTYIEIDLIPLILKEV